MSISVSTRPSFTTTAKEMAFSAGLWTLDAGVRVWRFVKRHAGKFALATASMAAAGAVTHGTGAALAVGTMVHASVLVALEFIRARREKRRMDTDALVSAICGSLLYTMSVLMFNLIAMFGLLLLFKGVAYAIIGNLYFSYLLVG
jgi:hypothetical protein